jgi:hypothetical protein
MANNRVPCNGQCYVRVKDGCMFFTKKAISVNSSVCFSVVMYRGCSWEYGFMTRQLAWTPIYDQGATWVFCDTSL